MIDPSQPTQWWEVAVACSTALEDTVYWEFDQLGAQGTVSQRTEAGCRVAAYLLPEQFQSADFESLQMRLAEAIAVQSVEKSGEQSVLVIPQVSWQLIAEEDWSQSWKVHWQAEEIGDRLLINPAWMTPPETERTILTLDPGSAFGTGAHATTQLCLKALEKQDVAGLKLADIGCGSGILSITALLYGAERIYAADVDPLAVKSTRANADLNNVSAEQLHVELGSIAEVIQLARQDGVETGVDGSGVDGILCNILSEIIVALIIPYLNDLAGEKTWGIFSGILTAKASWVEEHLNAYGWQVIDTTHQDEWCALTISRS